MTPMNNLVLSQPVLNKLHDLMEQLAAEHPKAELERVAPIVNSGICKPCKGGCGSLNSILGVTLDGSQVHSGN